MVVEVVDELGSTVVDVVDEVDELLEVLVGSSVVVVSSSWSWWSAAPGRRPGGA